MAFSEVVKDATVDNDVYKTPDRLLHLTKTSVREHIRAMNLLTHIFEELSSRLPSD